MENGKSQNATTKKGTFFTRKIVISVIIILALVLVPLGYLFTCNRLLQKITAVGRDHYMQMISMSKECEPLGITNCLGPRTYGVITHPANHTGDIAEKAYTTSTEYFTDLSNVSGFGHSISILSPDITTTTRTLTSSNNAWAVLANVKDKDVSALPILITRNVDIEALNHVLKTGITSNDFSTPVQLDTMLKIPFGKRVGILIRKDGKTEEFQKKHTTLGTIFGNTEIPPRPDSEPPLMYLQP